MIECLQDDLNALVTKSDLTITIETEPRMAECDPIRFVIKNDGSGGYRENRRGFEWVRESVDRDLTIRK